MERREFVTPQGINYSATWDYLNNIENDSDQDDSDDSKEEEVIVTFFKNNIQIGT